MSHESATRFPDFASGKTLYLSCGDSADTDIASATVDAVITDPPFFDNVHYSELADFFYVWQRFILGRGERASDTTRSDREVQRSEVDAFEDRLAGVWQECHRVLRPNGLLVFSYHHSRAEGWKSMLGSLVRAGFFIVRAHPVKAEMSVAVPKQQAREPIDLDMILVCRKRMSLARHEHPEWPALLSDAIEEAARQLKRLQTSGRPVSRNDVRVVVMAQTIARVTQHPGDPGVAKGFEAFESKIEGTIDLLLAS
jgi:adenine-specific DNA methylase